MAIQSQNEELIGWLRTDSAQLKALAEGQQRIEQGQNVLKADLDGLREFAGGCFDATQHSMSNRHSGLAEQLAVLGERLAAIEQLIQGLHGSYDLVLAAGAAKTQRKKMRFCMCPDGSQEGHICKDYPKQQRPNGHAKRSIR